jgi:hypothetical protein
MKRREFLKATCVGMAATAVAKPAVAQQMPELKWRLIASWPKSLDTLYGNPEYMAKRIAELSDNKFQIQVFAAGEIVPGLQVLDAVQSGSVEMGHTATYYYFGKDPSARPALDGVSCKNIRLSSAGANPLRRSRNWRADGEGCVGFRLQVPRRAQPCDGSHGWRSEPRRGSSSDRILIAENRCADGL